MEKHKYNKYLYFFLVSSYAIIINQYFGNIGLHSLDSTIGLNNGYR